MLLFFLILISSLNELILHTSARKLAFLFNRDDFFCPLNHKKTLIEDLCYLVSHKRKNSYNEAQDHCNKYSHGLAQIKNINVWHNIKFGLNQIFDSNSGDHNFSFYIQSNLTEYKTGISTNNVQNYLANDFFCNKTTNKSAANLCLELRYFYFSSNRSSLACLNYIKCKRSRYCLCEWRGDKIESFNDHLKIQILNAFISVIFALFLFFTAWFLLYVYHKNIYKHTIENHLRSYLKEKELFSLND